MVNIPIQQELTYCGAYPWSCRPLVPEFFLGYGIYLLGLLIISFIVIIFIYLFGKLFKKSISFKKSIGITFSMVLIFITFLVIRFVILAGSTLFNTEVMNCLIRNAPSECYEFAGMHYANSRDNYLKALNICNLTYDSSQCKISICENLTDTNHQECKNSVIKTCPNGYILDNIPCACDEPAGPYAVYDNRWLNEYWNKYHKGDTFEYCCRGQQQDGPCVNSL